MPPSEAPRAGATGWAFRRPPPAMTAVRARRDRRKRRPGRRLFLPLCLSPAACPHRGRAGERTPRPARNSASRAVASPACAIGLLGENKVEAMLAFKLDPAIARAFGKSGIAAIQAAEGTLVDAEITGTDAGAAISRLGVARARAEDELKRIDAELAKTSLSASERAELQRQRADITQRISATNDSASRAARQPGRHADGVRLWLGQGGPRLRRQLAADERGRHGDRLRAGHVGRSARCPGVLRSAGPRPVARLAVVAALLAAAARRITSAARGRKGAGDRLRNCTPASLPI